VQFPQTPTFKPQLFSLTFDGGIVVGDLETNNLYVKNAAAGAIWTLLQAGLTIREATSVLCQSFSLSEREALSHIDKMLGEWDRLGLIGSSTISCAKSAQSLAAPSASVLTEATGTYLIGGLAFSISTDDPDVAAHVFAVLRALQATEAAPHHALSVTRTADGGSMALLVDGAERLQVESAAEMIGAIFQTVLELRRGDKSWMALIHGASVAVGDVGILLSGASGSGKSTLAAYLSARGFDYLSDDLVALSKEGEIVPWPVPHSLKRGSWKTLEHLYPEIAEAKIEWINGREMKFMPAPLEAWNRKGVDAQFLIFPHYDPNHSMAFKKITPLLALQRLIEDRIWLGNPIEQSTVERFLAKLELIPAYTLQYHDLQQAEESIRELINRRRDHGELALPG